MVSATDSSRVRDETLSSVFRTHDENEIKDVQHVKGLRSALKVKTVNDSLHREYGASNSNNTHRRNITFNTSVRCEIFKQTIGDNPSVKNGPPIQLEWKSYKTIQHNLDEMIMNGLARCKSKTRYPRKVFNIPTSQRTIILKMNGHSRGEIQQATKMATISRNRIRKSIQRLPNDAFDERVEHYVRLLKGCTIPHSTKNETVGYDYYNDADFDTTECSQQTTIYEQVQGNICIDCCYWALYVNNESFKRMYKCPGGRHCMKYKKGKEEDILRQHGLLDNDEDDEDGEVEEVVGEVNKGQKQQEDLEITETTTSSYVM